MVLFSLPSKAWTKDDAARGLVRARTAETPSPHQQGQTERSNSRGRGRGVRGVEEEEKRKKWRGGYPPWMIAEGPSLSFFFVFFVFSTPYSPQSSPAFAVMHSL